jgi:hypothetical protein
MPIISIIINLQFRVDPRPALLAGQWSIFRWFFLNGTFQGNSIRRWKSLSGRFSVARQPQFFPHCPPASDFGGTSRRDRWRCESQLRQAHHQQRNKFPGVPEKSHSPDPHSSDNSVRERGRFPAAAREPEAKFAGESARSIWAGGGQSLARRRLERGHPDLPRRRARSDAPHLLDCGDTSPLSHWETCLPVPKRGLARALHTSQRQRRDYLGSADWQSAVSRIGNSPGGLCPGAFGTFHVAVPGVRPADCQSAIQQVANLRYAAGSRSNFAVRL